MPTRTRWYPNQPGQDPQKNRGSVTGCTLDRVAGGVVESCPINTLIQGTKKTMATGDNDKTLGRNMMGGAAGGALVGTAVSAMACKGIACGVLTGGPAGMVVGGLLGLLVGVGKVVKSLATATSAPPPVEPV